MENLFFRGIVDFSSVNKIDTYGKYSLSLVIAKDDVAKYQSAGIQGTITGTDAGPRVVFSRVPTRVNKKTGELLQFGPPKVIDKNGAETDLFVMKGEEVIVKVAVYDTIKGKGCTLESVMLPNKEGTFKDQELKHDPQYTGPRF